MSHRKPLKSTAVTAARAGAIGAVGGVLALVGAGESSGHLEFNLPVHVGKYLYGDSSCTPNAHGEGPGDPINVVFWRSDEALPWYQVGTWVANYAGLRDSGGADKWFLDHGSCDPMQHQNGTASGWLPVDRYHARYNELPAPANAVLVPTHFEEFEATRSCGPEFGPFGQFGGHAVPDEEDYFGLPWTGFLQGRYRITEAFSDQPGFTVQLYWWGNDAVRRQCDNGEPWSDGRVAYIKAPPSSGGGGNIGSGSGSGCPRFIPCF